MELVIKIIVVASLIGIFDYLWLGKVAKKLYYAELDTLLLAKPRLVPALGFYALYTVGVIIFVLNPALAAASLAHALGYGALFGLVAYGTYDLTNLSVTKDFTTKIALIDIVWGMVMTAAVSSLAYIAVRQVTTMLA